MGELIEFPSNGGTGQGYLSGGPGPGLVVIQEWWGLNDNIKDIAERFAGAGFTALAPDLYRGEVVSEPDEAGKHMMALNIEQAAKDMSGAIDEVRKRSGKPSAAVGVTGFCMGGGLALLLATQRPDAVGACAPFYGVIPWPAAQPDWSKMKAAVQGHYAENDGFASPDTVRALESQLKDLGVEVEMFIYPATQHAFFNDTNAETHDPEASKLAWERVTGFLRTKLGS